MTYECETVVRDGMVAVHPALDGKRVHIIVIPADEPANAPDDALESLFASAVPGVKFTPLSRDEAHER
jgi:hypothetical protein